MSKLITGIAELTRVQVQYLEAAVAGKAHLVVFEPCQEDSDEEQIGALRRALQMDKLAEIGLVENISATCREAIEKFFLENGFGFQIFKVTPMARLMFQINGSEIVN